MRGNVTNNHNKHYKMITVHSGFKREGWGPQRAKIHCRGGQSKANERHF